VIVAEALAPLGKAVRNGGAKTLTALQFDAMALAVIETERLDGIVTIECPREACGRVLAAGKQHECAVFSVCSSHRETPYVRFPCGFAKAVQRQIRLARGQRVAGSGSIGRGPRAGDWRTLIPLIVAVQIPQFRHFWFVR
jgi:hypothetical protein